MIHHVSLEGHRGDTDAHRAFWTELGFAEVTPPAPLRDRAVWFERNGTQVHVLFAETPVVPPDGHVAIQVDDLDALELELELEERAQHWGERRVYARAPGGHRVELFEIPPETLTATADESGSPTPRRRPPRGRGLRRP